VPLAVAIDLVMASAVPRMPAEETCRIAGVPLPLFRLAPFQASAAAKVRLALGVATGRIMRS
jgi:hypothetical protein